MKQLIFGVFLSFISVCSFAGFPVEPVDIPTDGWVFFVACNGEAVEVDPGQSLRARFRIIGTPGEERLHVINRVTGHLTGTGSITGSSYFINQVFSPINVPPAPPGTAVQAAFNDGNGAATFLTRYEVFSPGAPELGVLIVHGLVHIVFRGDIETFDVIKQDGDAECRGPNDT
jgi:hypothetical protein